MENELKQKHKVIKKKNGYVHKIEVKYPEENVAKMQESWAKGVEEINTWLSNYDNNMKSTIENGEKTLLNTLEQKQKYFEEYDASSDEEKLKKMQEFLEKEKKEFEEAVAKKDELLEKNKQEIISEFEKIKRDVEVKRSNYLEALNLWNNPEGK